MKKSVVSVHFTTECNLQCPFCYKERTDKKSELPRSFWIELVPYIKKISNQMALGGGEPFVDPKFIQRLSKTCKKNKLILNVTSNGKLLQKMNDLELKQNLVGITMISLSFDKSKVKTATDLEKYKELVKRIKKLTKVKVGCNLLIDNDMFKNHRFVDVVNYLFDNVKVERVFALYPKNIEGVDIVKYGSLYMLLSKKYKHFYIDDLTKMILEEGKYDNWEKSCHYGKDIISINEQGFISGCSFDKNSNAVLHLEQPKDLLKIKKIKFQERNSCPYLKLAIKTEITN